MSKKSTRIRRGICQICRTGQKLGASGMIGYHYQANTNKVCKGAGKRAL